MISGKDALIAVANGEEVQYRVNSAEWCDFNKSMLFCPETILTGINRNGDNLSFRIKPKTITINGIEVPAPSITLTKYVYVLSSYTKAGYQSVKWHDGFDPSEFWNEEEEIKQVVEALRNVFHP